MLKQMTLLAAAALALTGCDAATQMAGDAVEAEIRNAVVLQCQEMSQSAGIVADRVAGVCECSADAFLNDPDLTADDISRENIETIVNECATSAAPAAEASADATPTEQ
ncbi:hypothetical protein [Erythrobacter sp. EC-HK427]|uniref:hypothetical protein n=1 Tax=Erythrobacter sp. EC-HK427 TaxID=2038396 RepID=UPI001255AB80|nr:hypothetical protein [Erythrobacter sp. EC-HK427]VVT12565.1 conserved exported hypothetical protein [Erythrobacter sp. EC-HK427]